MPRFCLVFSGPRVTVRPQVISGETSSGQQVCTGSRARSTSSPSHTISWHGADERSFGAICITCMNTGRVFCQTSLRLRGGSGSLRNASSRPTSRSAATGSSPASAPIASATRPGVPNRLHSTGIECAFRRLEQQRRTGRLEHAVADLGHLEARVDFDADALDFAIALELGEEVAEIVVFHDCMFLAPSPDLSKPARARSAAPAARANMPRHARKTRFFVRDKG